jgi:hypothetical protein
LVVVGDVAVDTGTVTVTVRTRVVVLTTVT